MRSPASCTARQLQAFFQLLISCAMRFFLVCVHLFVLLISSRRNISRQAAPLAPTQPRLPRVPSSRGGDNPFVDGLPRQIPLDLRKNLRHPLCQISGVLSFFRLANFFFMCGDGAFAPIVQTMPCARSSQPDATATLLR